MWRPLCSPVQVSASCFKFFFFSFSICSNDGSLNWKCIEIIHTGKFSFKSFQPDSLCWVKRSYLLYHLSCFIMLNSLFNGAAKGCIWACDHNYNLERQNSPICHNQSRVYHDLWCPGKPKMRSNVYQHVLLPSGQTKTLTHRSVILKIHVGEKSYLSYFRWSKATSCSPLDSSQFKWYEHLDMDLKQS